MPKYLVELTDGRKFEVEADQAPTENDLMSYIGEGQAPAAPKETPSYLSQLGTALSIGGRQMTSGVKATFNAATGDVADTAEAMAQMGALQQEQQAAQSSEDIQLNQDFERNKAEYDSARGIFPTIGALGGYVGSIASNPGAAFKQAVQSAPNAAISAGTGLAGYALGGMLGAGAGIETGPGAILTGIAGAAAGGAVSNTLMESGPAIYDILNERTNGAASTMTADQISRYLRKNPDIMSEGLKTGAIRGSVIGLIEGLGMKGAGRIMTIPERAAARAAQKTLVGAGIDVASKEAVESALLDPALKNAVSVAAKTAKDQFTTPGNLGRLAGASALEVGSSGAGELAAQAASGQETDMTAAVQEMMGEVGMSAPTALVSKGLEARKYLMPKPVQEAVAQAEESVIAASDVAPLTAQALAEAQKASEDAFAFAENLRRTQEEGAAADIQAAQMRAQEEYAAAQAAAERQAQYENLAQNEPIAPTAAGSPVSEIGTEEVATLEAGSGDDPILGIGDDSGTVLEEAQFEAAGQAPQEIVARDAEVVQDDEESSVTEAPRITELARQAAAINSGAEKGADLGFEKVDSDKQRFEQIKNTPSSQRTDEDIAFANAFSKKQKAQTSQVSQDSRKSFFAGNSATTVGKLKKALDAQMNFRNLSGTVGGWVETLFNEGWRMAVDARGNRQFTNGDKALGTSGLGKVGMNYADHLSSIESKPLTPPAETTQKPSQTITGSNAQTGAEMPVQRQAGEATITPTTETPTNASFEDLEKEVENFNPTKGAARKDPATPDKIKDVADRVIASGQMDYIENIGYFFSDIGGDIPAKTRDPVILRLRSVLLEQAQRLKNYANGKQPISSQETPTPATEGQTKPMSGDSGSVVRDKMKPEQMTPEEVNSLFDDAKDWANTPDDKIVSKYQKQFNASDAYIQANPFAPEYWRENQRKVASGASALKQHTKVLNAAIEAKKPVSAAAVDAYKIKLPEGYVKDGELYIYKEEAKAEKAPTETPSESLSTRLNSAKSREEAREILNGVKNLLALKDLAKEMGYPTTGTKKDVVNRLVAAVVSRFDAAEIRDSGKVEEKAKAEENEQEKAKREWQQIVAERYAPTWGTTASSQLAVNKELIDTEQSRVPREIIDLISANKNVSVEMADQAKIKGIDGYVRDGEVYRPESKPSKAPEKQAPSEKVEAEEVKSGLISNLIDRFKPLPPKGDIFGRLARDAQRKPLSTQSERQRALNELTEDIKRQIGNDPAEIQRFNELLGLPKTNKSIPRIATAFLEQADALVSEQPATMEEAFGQDMSELQVGDVVSWVDEDGKLHQGAILSRKKDVYQIADKTQESTVRLPRHELSLINDAGKESRTKALDSIIGTPQNVEMNAVSSADGQESLALVHNSGDVPGVLNAFVGTSKEFLANPQNEKYFPELFAILKNGRVDEGNFAYGRAFVFTDGIGVNASDRANAAKLGISPAVAAVRRVLIHEGLVHRGIYGLPARLQMQILQWVKQNAKPEDLDALAKTYPQYADWATNPQQMLGLAEEFLAKNVEKMTRFPTSGPLARLVEILKDIWRYVTGKDGEPTVQNLRDIVKLLKAGAKAADARLVNGGGIKMSQLRAQGFVTPEMDAEYAKAVESGDMVKAQRMVDVAAKAAGYNTESYKGWMPFTGDWADTNGLGQPLPNRKGTKIPITTINRTTPFPTFLSGEHPLDGIAGFFASDKKVADKFAAHGGDWRTDKFYLKDGKQFTIDAEGKKAGELQFTKADSRFRDAVRSGNYDSILLKGTADEGDVFVQLNPNQIKSADPITRDDSGQVIPLSQRFNPAKADIRESRISYTNPLDAQLASASERMRQMREKQGAQEAPISDDAAILDAYQRLRKEGGFKTVKISQLQQLSGVPLDKLHDFIKRESRAGRATPSGSDFSIASPEQKAAAITYKGIGSRGGDAVFMNVDLSLSQAESTNTSPQSIRNEIRKAYDAAIQGQGSVQAPLQQVYDLAKAAIPTLTEKQFGEQVQALYEDGSAFLVPTDRSADMLAAGEKWGVYDVAGLPASYLGVMPSQETNYGNDISTNTNNIRPRGTMEPRGGSQEYGGNTPILSPNDKSPRANALRAVVDESTWRNLSPEQKKNALDAFGAKRLEAIASKSSLPSASYRISRTPSNHAFAAILPETNADRLVVEINPSIHPEHQILNKSALEAYAFMYDMMQEEIIHFAQHYNAWQQWVKGGAKGSINAFEREHLINQLRDVYAQRDAAIRAGNSTLVGKIDSAIIKAWNLYDPSRQISNIGQLQSALAGADVKLPEFMMELTRQLVQIGRQDFTTETGWAKFRDMLIKWANDVRDALSNVLASVRGGEFGQILKDEISSIERIVDQIEKGDGVMPSQETTKVYATPIDRNAIETEIEKSSKTPITKDLLEGFILRTVGMYGQPSRVWMARLDMDAPLQVNPQPNGELVIGLGARQAGEIIRNSRSQKAGFKYLADAIEEEMIHFADLLAMRTKWEAQGSNGSFTDFIRRQAMDLSMDLRKTADSLSPQDQEALRKMLVANVASYYGSAEIMDDSLDAILQFYADRPMNANSELIRSLIQAKNSGEITATGYQRIANTLVKWLKDVLNWLQQAYGQARNGGFGNVLAQRIQDTEKQLEMLGVMPTEIKASVVPKNITDKQRTEFQKNKITGKSVEYQGYPLTDSQGDVIEHWRTEQQYKPKKQVAEEFVKQIADGLGDITQLPDEVLNDEYLRSIGAEYDGDFQTLLTAQSVVLLRSKAKEATDPEEKQRLEQAADKGTAFLRQGASQAGSDLKMIQQIQKDPRFAGMFAVDSIKTMKKDDQAAVVDPNFTNGADGVAGLNNQANTEADAAMEDSVDGVWLEKAESSLPEKARVLLQKVREWLAEKAEDLKQMALIRAAITLKGGKIKQSVAGNKAEPNRYSSMTVAQLEAEFARREKRVAETDKKIEDALEKIGSAIFEKGNAPTVEGGKTIAKKLSKATRKEKLLKPGKMTELQRLLDKTRDGWSWKQIFTMPQAGQVRRRADMLQKVKENDAFKALNDEEKQHLVELLDQAWYDRKATYLAGKLKANPAVRLPFTTNKGAARKLEEATPELLKAFNDGTFNKELFNAILAKKYGVKTIDKAAMDRAEKLAEELQDPNLPDPVYAKKADELLKLIADTQDLNRAKILNDFWVTSVLAGPRTWFDIGLAALNGLQRILVDSTNLALHGDFKTAGTALSRFVGIMPQAFKEAAHFIKNGDVSILVNSKDQFARFLGKGLKGGQHTSTSYQLANWKEDKEAGAPAWKKAQGNILRTVGRFMQIVERLLTALDHINATATKYGYMPIAIAQNQKKYTQARLPNAREMDQFRTQAKGQLLGGREPSTADEKTLLEAWTRHFSDKFYSEWQDVVDGASYAGAVSSGVLDPEGIVGAIYNNILGAASRATNAADSAKVKAKAMINDPTHNQLDAYTKHALATIGQLAAYSARNLLGFRFIRFGAVKFNDSLTYIPAIGLLRLNESENKHATKQQMIWNNQAFGVALTILGTLAIQLLAEEDDPEKRGFDITGSLDGLTAAEKKQISDSGQKEYTLTIYRNGKPIRLVYKTWPISAALSAIGTLADMVKYKREKWDEKQFTDRLVAAVVVATTSTLDSASMSQFAELIGKGQYADDPDEAFVKKITRVTTNFAGGFVPRVFKDLDFWLLDPNARKYDTVWQNLGKEIPIWRQHIGGEKLDIFANPVKTPRSPWSRAIVQQPEDEAYNTLGLLNSRDLWLVPGNPELRTIGTKNHRRGFTPEEQNRYIKLVGAGYKQLVEKYGERMLQMPKERAKAFLADKSKDVRDAAEKKAIRRLTSS